jgi:hypothetical protein
LLILLFYVIACRRHRGGGNRWPMPHQLRFCSLCEFAIPAAADTIEAVVSVITITYVGLSFDAMMKSGTVVGASIIAWTVFKRHFHGWQWVGVVGVLIDLLVVGFSGLVPASQSSTTAALPGHVGLILLLKLFSEFLDSIKMSYETYFVQKLLYHPMIIYGAKGLWSLFMSIASLVVANYLPGIEGNGLREDAYDTFAMLRDNGSLWVLVGMGWVIALIYKSATANLSSRTTAAGRAVTDVLQMFLIWMLQLAISVVVGGSTSSDVKRWNHAVKVNGHNRSL